MDELYRIERVAKILDCNRKNVYYLIQQGKLKALRMSPRRTRILKSSLEEYINEGIKRFHNVQIPKKEYRKV
ncbi:helix-turn-helix domain-containing protein [Candidatus Sumerlaeota bacterium]|nr:helix-turn-helix domain-containing protein [Candidatus Sumerlaeota bacterium]